MSPLEKEAPDVATILPVTIGQVVAETQTAKSRANVRGSTDRWLEINDVDMAVGSFFDTSQVRSSARVVVLDNTLAADLSGSDPTTALNRAILINHQNFKVIGVLQSFNALGAATAVTPLSSARRYVYGDTLDQLIVQATRAASELAVAGCASNPGGRTWRAVARRTTGHSCQLDQVDVLGPAVGIQPAQHAAPPQPQQSGRNETGRRPLHLGPQLTTLDDTATDHFWISASAAAEQFSIVPRLRVRLDGPRIWHGSVDYSWPAGGDCGRTAALAQDFVQDDRGVADSPGPRWRHMAYDRFVELGCVNVRAGKTPVISGELIGGTIKDKWDAW